MRKAERGGDCGRIVRLVPLPILVIALLIVLMGLSSCEVEDELPDFSPLLSDESEGLSSESDSEQEEPFATSIRIVLPEDRSIELYERAQTLGDAIAERTGIPYGIVNDKNSSTVPANVYELVIGESGHPDCALWMRGLKKDDYICAVGRYAAVIGGKSETATLLALDSFEERLLPGVTRGWFVPQGVQILEKTEYERGFVSWNGEELSNFTVVYDAVGGETLLRQAEFLCEEIDRISGYAVLCTPDRDTSSPKRFIRLLIEEELEQVVKLCPTEDGIILKAGTSLGLKKALDVFLERLFLDEDGDGDCENRLEHTELLLAEKSDFRLGYVVESPSAAWIHPETVATVTDWIRVAERDGMFVSELPEKNIRRLRENLFDWQWTVEETTEGIISFLTVTEDQRIFEDKTKPEGMLGAYRIGGSEGGFHWLVVKEGTELPEWVYEEGEPFLITVYGAEHGRLAQDSADKSDCLYNVAVEADGETRYFSVYSASSCLSVRIDMPVEGRGLIDLWVERLY